LCKSSVFVSYSNWTCTVYSFAQTSRVRSGFSTWNRKALHTPITTCCAIAAPQGWRESVAKDKDKARPGYLEEWAEWPSDPWRAPSATVLHQTLSPFQGSGTSDNNPLILSPSRGWSPFASLSRYHSNRSIASFSARSKHGTFLRHTPVNNNLYSNHNKNIYCIMILVHYT
jgi:hypothetical protein